LTKHETSERRKKTTKRKAVTPENSILKYIKKNKHIKKNHSTGAIKIKLDAASKKHKNMIVNGRKNEYLLVKKTSLSMI
jgi:hypothetical protein